MLYDIEQLCRIIKAKCRFLADMHDGNTCDILLRIEIAAEEENVADYTNNDFGGIGSRRIWDSMIATGGDSGTADISGHRKFLTKRKKK